jgi:hypothetical protein
MASASALKMLGQPFGDRRTHFWTPEADRQRNLKLLITRAAATKQNQLILCLFLAPTILVTTFYTYPQVTRATPAVTHRHPIRPSRPGHPSRPSQAQNRRSLDRSVAAQHHRPDPRKRTLSGRHQIGIPAGFRSESVAGFLLELVAGFVGIRNEAFASVKAVWNGGQPAVHSKADASDV